jgi:hypothetical protein
MNKRFGKLTDMQLALALGAMIALVKLPLVFRIIGEPDQGRLILDAIVYASEGPGTLRKYGLHTSPLWTVPMSILAKSLSANSLVLLTNFAGWMCGALMSMLVFLLARRLGANRSWSAAAAFGIALVPGTFYMSLYGYPSQFALPWMLVAALAYARVFDDDASLWPWIAATAVAFTLLVLTKIDFALAGTFLVSIAVLKARLKLVPIVALPVIAVVAALCAMAFSDAVIAGESLKTFLAKVDGIYPWQADEVFAGPAATVLYSCGIGTWILMALALVLALARKPGWRDPGVRLLAWGVGALPIWLFWVARPPMSNRHAAPGIFVTVIVAALLGQRAFRFRYAAAVWVVALVAVNWFFGEPSHDFNYRPSGNLAATLRVHNQAFEVAHNIAVETVARDEAAKVLIGSPRRDVLHNIDLLPFVEVAMADRANAVRAFGNGWPLEFAMNNGRKTQTRPYTRLEHALRMPQKGGTYYALYGDDVQQLVDQEKATMTFDPNARLRALERR